MSLDHAKFRFSATCHTDDEAVLFCLRALCQFVEEHPKPQIGWGGTKTPEWRAAGNRLTLRFTRPEFRERFIREARRVLGDRWSLLGERDDDPARPQRH